MVRYVVGATILLTVPGCHQPEGDAPAACDAGTFVCTTGEVLEECTEEGWEVLEDCGSQGLFCHAAMAHCTWNEDMANG